MYTDYNFKNQLHFLESISSEAVVRDNIFCSIPYSGVVLEELALTMPGDEWVSSVESLEDYLAGFLLEDLFTLFQNKVDDMVASGRLEAEEVIDVPEIAQLWFEEEVRYHG